MQRMTYASPFGCFQSLALSTFPESRELEHLNEAGRMILQRTMAKRGDKGTWGWAVLKRYPDIYG